MTPPLVFISYSHDSADHKAWVLKLAGDLRADGVDATLDQWDLSPGQDVAAYMQQGISHSDRVLMVCTREYVEKADQGHGGVGYERLIVTAALVQSIDTKKFLPIVRNNSSPKLTPEYLGPRKYIDFSDDAAYSGKLRDLLLELHGLPGVAKPPIGPNPFSSVPPVHETRSTGPTGVTHLHVPVLDDEWFTSQAAYANEHIGKHGLNGRMELRFALHEALNKSQVELLGAVEKSEIHTFGWPIGVILGNRDEHRPRPTPDGIRAEIAIAESSTSGRSSYDYWSLRTNGDFYLLQSLFEDQRKTNALFFNTRIVRIAEAFLFARNLYSHLGVPPEVKLSVRITHRGLAGRALTSSNPNRQIHPATTTADASQSEVVVELGSVQSTLVDVVRNVAEPLFVLFDFKQFSTEVFTDIVRQFEQGKVT